METLTLKTIIIYICSGITIIGTPILIFLNLRKNRNEVKILESFTNKDLVTQVEEYKAEKLKVNISLKNYCLMLEEEGLGKNPTATKRRIKELNSIKDQVLLSKDNNMKYLNESFDEHSSIMISIIHSNIDYMSEIINKLDELIEMETNQIKK